MPISITSKPQALALVGEWVRRWRSITGSKSSTSSTSRKTTGAKTYATCATCDTCATFPKIITTPNPEIIVAAQSDPELMEALQEADLSIPDGVGIVWALKLLGCELWVMGCGSSRVGEGESVTSSSSLLNSQLTTHNSQLSRISGLDLMESLILQPQKVSPFELKVMLLGGRPGVAAKAARKCYELWVTNSQPTTHNTQLKIRALSGPQNISAISKSENNRLIAQINSFQPDLLFVAFGHPKQEKWLIANRESLTVGVAMAVGGALDQIADPSLRPPPYINSIGLGWLYRLLRQPWRVKRQLALLTFVFMIAKRRLSRNSRN